MKTKVKPHQEKRFNELNELLGKKLKLSNPEYLAALHEIRANYTIALQMRSSIGSVKDTGAITNIIDKVHWLIDSMEGHRPIFEDTEDSSIKIEYEMAYPSN